MHNLPSWPSEKYVSDRAILRQKEAEGAKKIDMEDDIVDCVEINHRGTGACFYCSIDEIADYLKVSRCAAEKAVQRAADKFTQELYVRLKFHSNRKLGVYASTDSLREYFRREVSERGIKSVMAEVM